MQQILVGRFHNPKDAEVAMRLLVADGIPQDNIALKGHGLRTRRASDGDQVSPSLLHGIGHFFERLFRASAKSEESDYAEPVPPGGAVVVVSVNSGRKSQLAHAALADMGAAEIEKH